MKQDNLQSLFFNCALECAIRRVQVNEDGLKFNGIYQLLVYADYINKMGGSVHTIKKNKDGLAAGLEVIADKKKYVVMSRDQNAGRSQNIRTDSSSFERMEQFKYTEP